MYTLRDLERGEPIPASLLGYLSDSDSMLTMDPERGHEREQEIARDWLEHNGKVWPVEEPA